MKKSLIALTSIALTLALQSLASANFNQIHRSTGGGRDRIVVPNQTPGQPVPLLIEATRNRSLTLNACGWGRFQHTMTNAGTGGITTIKVNGVSLTNFVTGAIPTCTSGVANVNHPVGSVYQDNDIWYIRGATGAGLIVAAVSSMNVVRAKANNCGFAQFRITASRPFTVFEDINANSYDLGTLPTTNTISLNI